jgi:hypothetical protein
VGPRAGRYEQGVVVVVDVDIDVVVVVVVDLEKLRRVHSQQTPERLVGERSFS